jgi:hypothetical protein
MTDSLERVRRLRARRAAAGKRRVDVYLSAAILAALRRLAEREEISVPVLIEKIISQVLKKEAKK